MFDYSSKLVTVNEALAKIKSGDVVTVGLACSEPVEFMTNMHTIAGKVEDITITNCLPMVMGEYITNPEYLSTFKIDSWFFTPALRKLAPTGRVSFVPNHLHLAVRQRNAQVKTNVFCILATPPDENGYFTYSCSNGLEADMAAAADMVILEISPNVPKTCGDNKIHFDKVDFVFESNGGPAIFPDGEVTEKDRIIGRILADYVNDGDCIQIGIGGIPNAVCEELMHKKDLGVHTELMTTGIMRLMQKGAVTNAKKQLKPGQTVCCFAIGTQELYDFMHENPDVQILNGSWVNDPVTIAQNDNQVSINTTLEIDLTGQCCSESIGHLQFTGTGGQNDTATGAQKSKNGRSFIALYSTAMVKNRETGEREEISKIVPMLKPGSPVSLGRNDIDYVVTEYGARRLKGLSIQKRAEALISIAHPKYRDELRKAAKELLYWI